VSAPELSPTQRALLVALAALPEGAWRLCAPSATYTLFALRDRGLARTRWTSSSTLDGRITPAGRALAAQVLA